MLLGDFLGLYFRDISLLVLYRLVPEPRCSSHHPPSEYFGSSPLPAEGYVAGVVTLICDALLALDYYGVEILRVPG